MGKNQWYHSGVGAPLILVYSGDWDVHWGYRILTHGQMTIVPVAVTKSWLAPNVFQKKVTGGRYGFEF